MKRVIIFLALLLIFTGCNETPSVVDNNTEKTNTGVSIYDDQNINSVIISNMNVAFYDNISHIAFVIKNENNNDITYNKLKITYYTKEDILVYEVETEIGTILKNSSKEFYLETDIDLTSTTKVEYELS